MYKTYKILNVILIFDDATKCIAIVRKLFDFEQSYYKNY